MSEIVVTKTRLVAGVWEGVVTGADAGQAPKIEVSHQGQPVDGLVLSADETSNTTWQLRIPVPVELLSDGVQVFQIIDKATGEKLDAFTILTGEPLDDDIHAEMELLRAELDMLKRAFRRHCLETA